MVQIVADVDQWGIDPLTVELFSDADTPTYTVKTIDVSLEGNPQILSADNYGTNQYWNLILIANALVHSSEMTSGMAVKLPIKQTKATVKKLIRTTI